MGELVDKTKGKIKQAVGDLTGNKKLHREGKADEFKGKIEGVIDDAKDAVKDTKKSTRDAVK